MRSAAIALAVAGLVIVWAPRPRLPWRDIAASAAAAGVAGTVVQMVVGVPMVAVLGAAAAAAAPTVSIRRSDRQRRLRRREAWPDAIDGIRAEIRSGATVPEALSRLADTAPEVLADRFVAAGARLSVGTPFPTAVAALQRPGDPIGDRVAAILRIAHEIGSADTGRVLATLSAFVRADVAQEREIAARHSWNLSAARIAVVAPWVTVAALSLQPSARAAYLDAAGTAVLTVVAAASALAYFAMSRLSRSSTGEVR